MGAAHKNFQRLGQCRNVVGQARAGLRLLPSVGRYCPARCRLFTADLQNRRAKGGVVALQLLRSEKKSRGWK
jgi:hypothetical protein